MKGSAAPTVFDESIIRPKDPVQILDTKVLNNTTEQFSESVECQAFRKFGLFLKMKSTSTPTTIQVKVQFLDRWTGEWHTYKQGLFAALFWEDQDLASGVDEMFTGDVAGRAMRITLTSVGTTSAAYFTVSASVEFWN